MSKASAVKTRAIPDTPPRGSRSEHAYRSLRGAIQEGTLKPGQRIMELEVADWLQVSRTPVRDAIRRLESEGLLHHEPRQGLVVAQIDRSAFMELYAMREVLEVTAARLCARHASDMEVLELKHLLELERELGRDYVALARHNRRFHDTLHRAAHNRYLEKSLEAVSDSLGLLGPSQMLKPERAKSAAVEHAELVRAIEKRDPELAEEVARRHVRTAQRHRLTALFPNNAPAVTKFEKRDR